MAFRILKGKNGHLGISKDIDTEHGETDTRYMVEMKEGEIELLVAPITGDDGTPNKEKKKANGLLIKIDQNGFLPKKSLLSSSTKVIIKNSEIKYAGNTHPDDDGNINKHIYDNSRHQKISKKNRNKRDNLR